MRLARTVTLALANQKGGCGKTTNAVSIAAGLAKLGYCVVIVDTDSQCNATDSFGLNRENLAKDGFFTVADAYLGRTPMSDIVVDFGDRFDKNLYLAVGHRGLAAVPQRLESELQELIAQSQHSELDSDDIRHEQRTRLKNSIASLQGHVDVVLIDTPPDLGYIMTTALLAADFVMIPVFPSGYDLKGLEALMATIEKVQKRFNPHLQLLGVALGNVDGKAKLDADIRAMLESKFGEGRVFQTAIKRSVKHRESPVYGRTILEHAPGTEAAKQFLALSQEVADRLEEATAVRKLAVDAPAGAGNSEAEAAHV